MNHTVYFGHIIKWNGGIGMPKGKARHMFPGGNTPKGFFSFYNNIINQEDAKRIFILKGGPGTGKSTFMKNIASEMLERGYDVEYMHCSSDNRSIDGIVIPGTGIAVIDGTAPHVIDPANPGAVDEIINLGEYWNEAGLMKYRRKILETTEEIRGIFARAYRHLKAAWHIYEDSAAIYEKAINKGKLNIFSEKLIEELFYKLPISESPGRLRCMFASAITPDGLINYLDDLMISKDIYMLEGFPGAGTQNVLERIKTAALERGMYVEAFYCAFNPGKLEHLIIPDIDVAFTTVNRYHSTDACALRRVNFEDMLNRDVAGKYRNELLYNQAEFDRLLDGAVKIIHNAKSLHDELEACYIPNMDFDALHKKWEKTMERVTGYIEEGSNNQ